ncbi:hypothetical protein MMC16_000454 [Acarospora aff. strigata]|nr:hypothetical protein [Acarospora aff. strigata]
MSSDDQYFLDILSGIPNDVKKYSLDLADAIDRQFDLVSAAIRESLQSATWIPQSVKPPPPRSRRVVPPMPQGSLARAQDWVLKHQALTAAIIAFVGTGGFLIYRRRRLYSRKRRARRASNGARKEVVVIAGSPSEPITRSLALDLERRGFIVYIVVNTMEEEQLVRNETRADIHPLNLDILDPLSAESTITRFTTHLQTPHQPIRTSNTHHPNPHTLSLTALILLPSPSYPTGPIETLTPTTWSDTLNTRILATTTTTQLFLPPLRTFRSRLLLLTPSIIPSLSPPFHAIQSATVAALTAYATTLAAELAPAGVHVVQFKLGTFEVPGAGRAASPDRATRADVLSWPASVRATYAKTYIAQSQSPITPHTHTHNHNHHRHTHHNRGTAVKGAPLRALHNAVFDALTTPRPAKVWHVGTGSLVYDFVGRWVPRGIVGWMVGLRSSGMDVGRGVGEGFGEGNEGLGGEGEDGTGAGALALALAGAEGSVGWERV